MVARRRVAYLTTISAPCSGLPNPGLPAIGFRSGVAYLGRLQWFRRQIELILIGVPFSSMANVVRLTRPNNARS